MLKVTPALIAPYRHGLTPLARTDRLRQVPAVTATAADPQERARAFYVDRIGEARASAHLAKGRVLNISA